MKVPEEKRKIALRLMSCKKQAAAAAAAAAASFSFLCLRAILDVVVVVVVVSKRRKDFSSTHTSKFGSENDEGKKEEEGEECVSPVASLCCIKSCLNRISLSHSLVSSSSSLSSLRLVGSCVCDEFLRKK